MFPIASTVGISNTAFNLMQGTQRASNLAFGGNGSSAVWHNAEKQNSMNMVKDRTLYKMQDVAYDSDKALRDKNIERTFSCFA